LVIYAKTKSISQSFKTNQKFYITTFAALLHVFWRRGHPLCGYQRAMRIPCRFSCPAAFYVPAARKARRYAPLLRAYALHFAASTRLYRLQRLNFSFAALFLLNTNL
jgi:hypothetical protein